MDKLNSEKKADKTNFNILWSIAIQKKGEYTYEKRAELLEYFMYLANRFGIPQKDFKTYCLQELLKHPKNVNIVNEDEFSEEISSSIKAYFEYHIAQFDTWVENEVIGDIETPTIPDAIYDSLPIALKQLLLTFPTKREKDVLLMGFLVILSNIIHRVQGRYGKKWVAANLFCFISAPASAGKGSLDYPSKIGGHLHEMFKDEYEIEYQNYLEELEQYNVAKEKGTKPIKPNRKHFYLAADSSSAALHIAMKINQIFGVIFDTEIDTLTQVTKNEWGSLTETIRKAFAHEPIRMLRKNQEDSVDLSFSYLSVLMSGTPNQLASLLNNVENGFFSRLLFYSFPQSPKWADVFSDTTSDLDILVKIFGWNFIDIAKVLLVPIDDDKSNLIQFEFTAEQRNDFNNWFDEKYDQLNFIYGDDMAPSIKRLGVICFRIAMIFNVIRIIDFGGTTVANPLEKLSNMKKLVCDDRDYTNAKLFIQTMLFHTINVYKQVKSRSTKRPFKISKEIYYDKLPDSFNRAQAVEIAAFIGIKEKTAESYLTNFIANDLLTRVRQNLYNKKNSTL